MSLFKATTLALLIATPALAGGMSAPVMEPEVIEEATAAGSRAGILVPVLAILLIGIALSNKGNSTPLPPASPGNGK